MTFLIKEKEDMTRFSSLKFEEEQEDLIRFPNRKLKKK